jgi:hypothetical protein
MDQESGGQARNRDGREEQCSGVVLTAKVVKRNEFEHDLLKAMDGKPLMSGLNNTRAKI